MTTLFKYLNAPASCPCSNDVLRCSICRMLNGYKQPQSNRWRRIFEHWFRNGTTLICFALLIGFRVYAQDLPQSLRNQIIEIEKDTIQIDTLSLAPGTLQLTDENSQTLPLSDFLIDYAHSQIIVINNKENYIGKTVQITYRILPINLAESYSHKDTSLIINNYRPSNRQQIYVVDNTRQPPFGDELDKNGSISRGFVFGNQRDLGTLSNLNLQLSGKLNDEVSILAAISDNNLPIQPEGNTQKIQEFDKVYIQLFTKNTGVKLGDIQLDKPLGYFLNLQKQTRGLNVYSNFDFGKKKKFQLNSEMSAGLAKGKYNRVKINGVEGNQGPYRLLGSNNETYIIILSGSEKVYIDGKLQTRGEKFDYVIDYNSAELVFTANQPITKDSRIIIEYEYAQQFYPRMQFMQTNHFQSNKSNFWLNFYLEQDNKNDPLSENYTDQTKQLLSQIGDSIHKAIAPNARQVEFQNDRVLYQLKDTLVNGINYDSIYVYSTNPLLAIYQLGFSYVGENQGNYSPIINNANGKVYEWIAPENGQPRGAYEPVSLFITPNKSLIASLGGNFKTNAFGEAGFEIATTNFDVNTYSPINGGDDIGYALKFNIIQGIIKADTNNLQLKFFANYQMADKQFKPIENFYNTEFERDWNLPAQTVSWEEQRAGAGFIFSKSKLGFVSAQANYMQRQNNYKGQKLLFNSNLNYKGFRLLTTASYLLTKDIAHTTDYLKHKLVFSKHFKHFTVGAAEETENNQWNLLQQDSLLLSSFKFTEYSLFFNEPDSSVNKFFASYKYREDFLPHGNAMQQNALAKTAQTGISLLKNKAIHWKTLITYRDLNYTDTMNSEKKHEDFLSGRQEITLRLAKGSINLTLFYETGSGLELRKQYQYIEVQKGQGQFTWIDYNQNNIKEIDEFELARFPDEANYIRVFIPSNDYLRAYSTQMSNSLLLQPSRVWMKEKGWRGFLALFTDQFAYRIMQKANNADYFPDISDNEGLISRTLLIRNNFSFRSRNRKWQTDILYENTESKNLLISGIDSRLIQNNSVRLSWSPVKLITFFNTALLGSQSYNSEFSAWKNYQLEIKTDEFSFQLQPNEQFYTTLSYRYSSKINITGQESVYLNELKLIANQNINIKINVRANLSFVQNNYHGEPNSAVAYEMLEGLQNGKNLVWNVDYNQKISKIFQLSIGYNGRSSAESSVIHNGSVQLRANF